MKTEINNINKAKFFAQYWGQKVFVWDYPEHSIKENYIQEVGGFLEKYYRCGKLQLKPLSQITDEDAIEVAKLVHERYNSVWWVNRNDDKSIIHVESIGIHNEIYHISMIYDYATVNANIHWPKTENHPNESFKINIGEVNNSSRNPISYIFIVDYLRSKGYALPWMGLSVDEMVDAGWIKLKS